MLQRKAHRTVIDAAERLKEAQFINKSLSALGNVMQALGSVKPNKKNGSWAMLGFQDAAAMQAASTIPVVVKDEEGDEDEGEGKDEEDGDLVVRVLAVDP